MSLAAWVLGRAPDREGLRGLAAPLGAILRRATDPRPEGRQTSANELARELSNPGEAFRNRAGGDRFRICVDCRCPVAARDYFCVHCGTELGPACKACGYDEVPSGDHCPLCGADFLRYPVHRAFLEAIRRRLFEGIEPFSKDDSS